MSAAKQGISMCIRKIKYAASSLKLLESDLKKEQYHYEAAKVRNIRIKLEALLPAVYRDKEEAK
jgi:hypothetical protein